MRQKHVKEPNPYQAAFDAADKRVKEIQAKYDELTRQRNELIEQIRKVQAEGEQYAEVWRNLKALIGDEPPPPPPEFETHRDAMRFVLKDAAIQGRSLTPMQILAAISDLGTRVQKIPAKPLIYTLLSKHADKEHWVRDADGRGWRYVPEQGTPADPSPSLADGATGLATP
jgi:hypothetical protein